MSTQKKDKHQACGASKQPYSVNETTCCYNSRFDASPREQPYRTEETSGIHKTMASRRKFLAGAGLLALGTALK